MKYLPVYSLEETLSHLKSTTMDESGSRDIILVDYSGFVNRYYKDGVFYGRVGYVRVFL